VKEVAGCGEKQQATQVIYELVCNFLLSMKINRKKVYNDSNLNTAQNMK